MHRYRVAMPCAPPGGPLPQPVHSHATLVHCMPDRMSVPLRIAVIGAGLAGLAAAWLLARRHHVQLFERRSRPGFTAQSVSVGDARGQMQRVDVPLRVFFPGYYPTLTRLYAAIGAASEPVSYAATLTDGAGRPYFRWRNRLRGDESVGTWAMADALLGARAWRIAFGLWKFARLTRSAGHGGAEGSSLGELAALQRWSTDFTEGFLLPAVCTVATCNTEQARAMPAELVLDYVQRGLGHQAMRRALHGADDVQQRLLAGLAAQGGGLVCDTRIRTLRRTPGDVRLVFHDGHEQAFDHVVLATQANQALALLGATARLDEAAVLDAFHYVPVEVLTHRDPALLPPRRADWSPVNLLVAPQAEAPAATIWINAVQPALATAPDLFQTVSPIVRPHDGLIVGRAMFERPLSGERSNTALQTLARLHQEAGRRVWFCGSYAQPGIPLLESAVRSAAVVAERLGAGFVGEEGGGETDAEAQPRGRRRAEIKA